jgi:hypothetical protein
MLSLQGVDTGVWARGDDADKVKGRMENDEFGRLIATLMAADLAQATDAVKFVPVSLFFPLAPPTYRLTVC